MIGMVGSVSVFVEDQQRAKAFYTEKLGMEVRIEAPLFPGSDKKWLEVVPPGAETVITLYVPDENWSHYRQVVGKAQALTLYVTEIHTLAETLRGRGVKILHGPEDQPWGTYMVIEDSEGNSLVLTASRDDAESS